MDNAREQTIGIFVNIAREFRCHIKQVEPYSPWQNTAEGAILEVLEEKCLHQELSHKLWDRCLDLEG